MKDFLSFIKDYGFDPIAKTIGVMTIGMFALTLIPSLNFIPKFFMLYLMMPFVFGK